MNAFKLRRKTSSSKYTVDPCTSLEEKEWIGKQDFYYEPMSKRENSESHRNALLYDLSTPEKQNKSSSKSSDGKFSSPKKPKKNRSRIKEKGPSGEKNYNGRDDYIISEMEETRASLNKIQCNLMNRLEQVKLGNCMHMDTYAIRYFDLTTDELLEKGTSRRSKKLEWTAQLIQKPLHKMNQNLHEQPLEAFKYVQSLISGQNRQKQMMQSIHNLLYIGYNGSDLLKDEIYCQVAKQTNKNPSIESTVRGWNLFLCLLSTFTPSVRLKPYILSYFHKNSTSSRNLVREQSKQVLVVYHRNELLETRSTFPSWSEIYGTFFAQKMHIKLQLVDKTKINVPVDSWTSGEEALQQALQQLQVTSEPSIFGLYKNTKNRSRDFGIDQMINAQSRVLDFVQTHMAEKTSMKERPQADTGFKSSKAKYLILKATKLVNPKKVQGAALKLLYIQSASMFYQSAFQCSEQDRVMLFAMQMQIDLGDYRDFGQAHGQYNRMLKAVSPRERTFLEEDTVVSEVLETYQRLQECSVGNIHCRYYDVIWSLLDKKPYQRERLTALNNSII